MYNNLFNQYLIVEYLCNFKFSVLTITLGLNHGRENSKVVFLNKLILLFFLNKSKSNMSP